MESYRFSSPEEGENLRVLTRNLMQAHLAERHGESIDDFIDKHAAQFGQVLDQHPEYLTEFDRDSEKTLKHIETILYH